MAIDPTKLCSLRDMFADKPATVMPTPTEFEITLPMVFWRGTVFVRQWFEIAAELHPISVRFCSEYATLLIDNIRTRHHPGKPRLYSLARYAEYGVLANENDVPLFYFDKAGLLTEVHNAIPSTYCESFLRNRFHSCS